VIATEAGVQALPPELDGVLAEQALGSVSRLAAAAAQLAALTSDGRVLWLDESLTPRGEVALGGRQGEDIAIDAEGRVAVTGWQPAEAGGECQGSLPFIEVYDATQSLLWSAYGFADAPGWCASSKGKRVLIAQGQLYYAGEQEGGNSVHQRDPRDLGLQAPLVSYDTFSTSAGKAIDEYSFVARFELSTGALQAGQVIVPRDAAGVGGKLFTSALAVDASGRIFLGGKATCCIEERELRSVAEQQVGAFVGEEASLLILSADLKERLSWATFTGAAGPAVSSIQALALGTGVGAAVGTTEAGELLVYPPAGSLRSEDGDGYFVSFPLP
jgi:hypothetical protein